MPPILVNVADLLSYWTNGLLKSAVHRVIVPRNAKDGRQGRYSIAYFLHPADGTQLIPIPSEMVRTKAGKMDSMGQKGHGR
jgi:isopenicillin N synthase-like dioxygenase